MVEEQKVRKKKKRRKKHYFLRLLLFIAIGIGVYYFLNSSFFDLEKITVANNTYYTKEQIIELSKAKTGINLLFQVDKDKIKKKLMKDPYIKSVKISKNIPNTIKIFVEEREEAAVIPYATSFILIDCDGLVLRKTDIEPKLPLLIGLTINDMETGKALGVEEKSTLTETLALLESTEDSSVVFTKIDISSVIIKAYIYEGLYCQGVPENILESIYNGNLEKVLYDLYSRGIERGIINIGSDNYCSFNPMVD